MAKVTATTYTCGLLNVEKSGNLKKLRNSCGEEATGNSTKCFPLKTNSGAKFKNSALSKIPVNTTNNAPGKNLNRPIFFMKLVSNRINIPNEITLMIIAPKLLYLKA